MDYPLQGPGLLSVPNLPELSAVRRVPLPPELVEQFGRIFSLIYQLLIQTVHTDSDVSIILKRKLFVHCFLFFWPRNSA